MPRLLVMFAVSVAVAGCNFFIPSTLGVVLFSVSMGFLLSLDLSQVTMLCRPGPRPASGGGSWGRRGGASPSPPSTFGWRLGYREILLYVSLLVAAMVEASLLHHFLAGDPPRSLAGGPRVLVITSYLLLALFVLCWVLGEVQGAYVCGGVFLNPLYPRGISNVQTFNQSSRGLHAAAAVRRVLLNLGESLSRSRLPSGQNGVYFVTDCWVFIVYLLVSPFAMIAYLSTDKSLQRLHTASLSVGFTRAFRVVNNSQTQRNTYDI